MSSSQRRRIAVIGSGVAGLTAAYILQRQADVTLYEADGRLGGHAHSHDLIDAGGRQVTVDSGFIVHNRATYPMLSRLFDELCVETQEAEMSMSICCAGCGLQYAGTGRWGGLFPTVGNLANPRYLQLLAEIPRFYRCARALLTTDEDENRTVADFLDQGRFSKYFQQHFVTPLISAVWSQPPNRAGDYPARYLFRFLANHGMLSVRRSHRWRTVTGGSQRYVELAVKHLTAIEIGTPVRAVLRHPDGIDVHDDADDRRQFDAAVIATHPAQALAMLPQPTALQVRTLGAMEYTRNRVLLHTDVSLLPATDRAAASWNYRMPSCSGGASAVQVTYDMNRLQRLSSPTRYLVTLNGHDAVSASSVLDRMSYEHPLYTPQFVAAQRQLPELGDLRLAFAGAYHGWGFHEDGCRSGIRAASRLGVSW